MKTPLKVLMVEDSLDDVDLTMRELRRAGFEPVCKRVEEEADFLAGIKELPDVVISDFSMPHFNGLRAAELLSASGLSIPFILVSGTVGEDVAVEAMKHGATDYLLKDRIARLGVAVEQALGQKRLRAERKRAEEALRRNEEVLRLFVEHSPAAIAMFDREMKYIIASRRYLVDYELGEQRLEGRYHYDVIPDIPDRWRAIHQRCLAGSIEKADEDSFTRADGSLAWVRWEVRPWKEADGGIGGIILFSEVITERKRADEEIRNQLDELRRWHEAMLGREDRILELKHEVNELLTRHNLPERYSIPTAS